MSPAWTGLHPSICVHTVDPTTSNLAEICSRLSHLGYRSIELLGEPDHYRPDCATIISDNGLSVSGITAASRPETGRDLTHSERELSQRALDNIRRSLDLAQEVGSPSVGATLTALGRIKPIDDFAREHERALKALEKLDALAAMHDKEISVEVLNRFTTTSYHSPSEMLGLLREAGTSRVRLGLDTFHLATELSSLSELRAVSGSVNNVQVAGSNRGFPSDGLVDMRSVIDVLYSAGYRGALALEAFAPKSRPFSDTSAVEPVWEFAARFVQWVAQGGNEDVSSGDGY